MTDQDIRLRSEREQLQSDGFCIVKDILSPDDLGWVRDIASRIVAGLSAEHRDEQKNPPGRWSPPVKCRS